MVTAFESKRFSELLNTLRCPITDVEVIATRYILTARPVDSESTSFDIRLYLENGQSVIFNSEDETFSLLGHSAKSLLDETRMPATEVLSLPDTHPFNRLLVTDVFAKWIKSFTASDNCREVIEVFWRDYQCLSNGREVLQPGKPILIQGEFGPFYATEFLCGRVSFHYQK